MGKVKTRLAASIGNQKALRIYEYLVSKAINSFIGNWDVQLHWAYEIPNQYLDSPNSFLQSDGNIGEKMMDSINLGLSKYEKVVLVGADIPNLSPQMINQAFKNLDSVDLVFGPALDGGYYLVGMKKKHTSVFRLNNWSHKNVLTDSLKIAEAQNLTYTLTETLRDLDTIKDLEHFPVLIKLIE